MNQNTARVYGSKEGRIFLVFAVAVVCLMALPSCRQPQLTALPSDTTPNPPSASPGPPSPSFTNAEVNVTSKERIFCLEDTSWHSIASFQSTAKASAWGARLYFVDPVSQLLIDSISGLVGMENQDAESTVFFEGNSYQESGNALLDRSERSLYYSHANLSTRTTQTQVLDRLNPLSKRLEYKLQKLAIFPRRLGLSTMGTSAFYEKNGILNQISLATFQKTKSLDVGSYFLNPTQSPTSSSIAGLAFDSKQEQLRIQVVSFDQDGVFLDPHSVFSDDLDQLAFEWSLSGNLLWLQKAHTEMQIARLLKDGRIGTYPLELPDASQMLPYFSIVGDSDAALEIVLAVRGNVHDELAFMELDPSSNSLKISKIIGPPQDHKAESRLSFVGVDRSKNIFAVWQAEGISKIYKMNATAEWEAVTKNNCVQPSIWQADLNAAGGNE